MTEKDGIITRKKYKYETEERRWEGDSESR